ncbi:patatin-like phospholipase family protein [Vibrio sagamiensis]|uniref:patatin-like phospholipase family protein n=1 Tax=Vibrio sagamiensis TaxID=512650 RepID=UPI000587095E|nr:patatin-like phospholipase family protein [Vibrio sagamiensis]PNQ53797.1 patatin family protein [Vibrio agarivorans]
MRNRGLITDHHVELDFKTYEQFRHGKTALIAQGGGQRGIFTSGVLDAFLLADFDPFDVFYGTSAGALNICAYLCRQKGMGKAFTTELTQSKEFFNLIRYIRNKQHMRLEWALDRIKKPPFNLDLAYGQAILGPRQAFAAVTDIDTLSDQYLPLFGDDWERTMIATCAIPKLYQGPVSIQGKRFVDGGIAASIPVQEAWRHNARHIVVIRTEPFSDKEFSQQVSTNSIVQEWLYEPYQNIQESWQQKKNQWVAEWGQFLKQKITLAQGAVQPKQPILNGGRWLFGADNLYRLSHLIGENFDSGLADMLMIHYQTFELTQEFLASPPDDAFILQLAPTTDLKSSSLMSTPEALEHDYQLGLKIGGHFVQLYNELTKPR